jgi:DNA replication protein DnaC
MNILKQENAMEDTAALVGDIVKMLASAKMPHLADAELYLGIPYPVLLRFRDALSLQRTEDGRKRFLNRMRYAGIYKERTANIFKWDDSTYPLADLGAIEQALSINFIYQKRNLVVSGPPGAGKTLLSVIVACKALREEFSVKYKTAHDIVTDLQEARSGNSLTGYIKKMQAYDVLVIEDITFSSPDAKTSQDFFSIIDKRYERKSTVITTNGNIKEWVSDFSDGSLWAGLLGRLYQEAVLINMNGAEDMRVKWAKGFFSNIANSDADGDECRSEDYRSRVGLAPKLINTPASQPGDGEEREYDKI